MADLGSQVWDHKSEITAKLARRTLMTNAKSLPSVFSDLSVEATFHCNRVRGVYNGVTGLAYELKLTAIG